MATFNLADLFEITADAVADRLALVAGDVRMTYEELDERATRFGRHLLDAGIEPGDHIAVLAHNRAEWLETMLAALKARAVPINVNWRYTDDELAYLLDNADAVALVAEASFADTVARLRQRLPRLRHVVLVDRPDTATADTVDYEQASAHAMSSRTFETRSGDDRYVLYTGGTTGSPKGVVWRSEDLFFAALAGGNPGGAPIREPEALRGVLSANWEPWLVTSPLMHGNGQWNSLVPLLTGRGVVLWTGARFDASAVARLAAAERVRVLILVGDAMALPFADALEADPAPPDLSSVAAIASGGALLSPSTKQRLTRLLPGCVIVDGFGASETGTSATAVGDTGDGPPRFRADATTAVLGDDLLPLRAGSSQAGRLARRGHIPLGYWNDAHKTAATFPVGPDGTRWAVPGDLAMHEADGTIRLLGRGSNCINTGGEKVFPEEVEAALKAHPDVADALVIGVHDRRFGQAVAALVVPRPGATVTLDALRAALRGRLAGYKLPRQLCVVDEVRYTPQAKPDYRWAHEVATREEQPV